MHEIHPHKEKWGNEITHAKNLGVCCLNEAVSLTPYTYQVLHEGLGGWIDGWVVGGWMDRSGQVEGYTAGCLGEWVDLWVSGWMGGRSPMMQHL